MRPLPSVSRASFAVVVAAILLRVALFPFGENLWGDAPVRGDLARAWAESPGLWWAYDRVFQFGPLPTHLGGLAIRLGLGPTFGPNVVSLLAGCLGVLLARRIADRSNGPMAGIAASAAVGLSPMHLQASTTFASEALFIAACLWCVDRALARDRFWCAVAAFAATTTRFDAWLFLPVLVLWWVFRAEASTPRSSSASTSAASLLRRLATHAVFFGVGPASILLANAFATGDPLAPLRHVSEEHLLLGAMEEAKYGALQWRLRTLFFWPTAWFVTLTPGFAVAAIVGIARAARERTDVLLAPVMGLTPPLIYAFRGVLGGFWPMTRFLTPAAALTSVAIPPLRRRALIACLILAVAFNVAIVAVEGVSSPRSPLSRLPDDLRAGVAAVKELPPQDVLLDKGPRYEHIVVAHHANRVHWKATRRKDAKGAAPERIVTFKGGELDAELRQSGRAFGAVYEEGGRVGRVTWWGTANAPAGSGPRAPVRDTVK